MATLLKSFNGLTLFNRHLKQSMEMAAIPCRWNKRTNPPPKKRHPEWLPKPQRVLYKEDLTEDNKQFIQEIIRDKYGPPNIGFGMQESPLKTNPIEPSPTWTPKSKRVGLIAKKIGVYPLWMKNGKKVSSTLLQIVDNQVVKYIPPEECNPVIKKPRTIKNKLGCLIVGAQTIDPQLITKEYYGMFDESGVPPKRILMRFYVTPDAALEPGTQLYAAHFQPGSAVDIRAKTIDRGFQGVMKRWGFKGMPASHGVTKTHRRPGNIGSGGERARVVPGTKLPGHMGNRWRTIRGYRVLRVNTKYNVLWIQGQNIPGETNSYCYIFDTVLPLRKNENPYFPTYLPGVTAETIPEDLYVEDIHQFNEATIEYSPES